MDTDAGLRQAPRHFRRWRIAILLGVGVLINFFDRVNLSVAHDLIVHDFHISALTFGILASSYAWTYAILQVPIGVLLDRIGVRIIGRVSALIWCVSSLLGAAAPGIGAFFGARLLLGVGEAPTFPMNAKAVGYWFPDQERSFATSLFDAAAKLSSAIGVPLLGAVLLHFGWRWTFALTGAISFFYLLSFWSIYRNPGEDPGLSEAEKAYLRAGHAQPENDQKTAHGARLLYLVSKPAVIGASIGFAAYNYTFYLLLTWLPAYLSSSLHIDLLHSVIYTSIPWGFATATDLLLGGWLVDHLVRRGVTSWKVRQAVLCLGMLCGTGIVGASYAHTPHQALAWISLSIGGLGAMAPVGWSIPTLIAPSESVGRVGGIMNFATQIAAISAPIVTGYFAGHHNFRAAFVVAAVFLVVGAASYLLLLGRIKAIPEPPRALSAL